MLQAICFKEPVLSSMASPSLSTGIIWKQLWYGKVSLMLWKALRKPHEASHSEMLLCHLSRLEFLAHPQEKEAVRKQRGQSPSHPALSALQPRSSSVEDSIQTQGKLPVFQELLAYSCGHRCSSLAPEPSHHCPPEADFRATVGVFLLTCPKRFLQKKK